jgi:hypothetical protein
MKFFNISVLILCLTGCATSLHNSKRKVANVAEVSDGTQINILMSSLVPAMSDSAKKMRNDLEVGQSIVEYEFGDRREHEDMLILRDLEARIVLRINDHQFDETPYMNFVPSTYMKNFICNELGYSKVASSELGQNQNSRGLFNAKGIWGSDSHSITRSDSKIIELHKQASFKLKGNPVKFSILSNAAYLERLVCTQ